MDDIMVSICMITYNHEKYIIQAIEGVLMQKTNFPIELIIGEDYSTDNTRKICLEYKEKYPNIIKLLLPDKNLGANQNSRNTLEACRGKYIAMCEGDDYWTDSHKLQKQVDFLEMYDDFSMCFHNAIRNNLYDGTRQNFNNPLNKNIFNIKDVILKPWFTPTASIVYRNDKDFVDIEWYGINGDMKILFLNSLKGKLYYFDEIMSMYNYGTPGSISDFNKHLFMPLYRKKFVLLNHFDQYTHFKYFHLTSLKRIKMVIGIFLKIIRIR
ncbi:hypothetical protein AGMMS49574_19170 [Bacteroidia bacterium]|nr:hypothetical protein AGMMS49574_19170 [Bacteroidia bacterium]